MLDPSRVVVTGPLERYSSGFAVELVGAGYLPVARAFQLQLMAHVSRWLASDGLGPDALTGEVVERFLAAHRAAGYTSYLTAKALAPLLGYLRELGVVPPDWRPALSGARRCWTASGSIWSASVGWRRSRRAVTWTWSARSSWRARTMRGRWICGG